MLGDVTGSDFAQDVRLFAPKRAAAWGLSPRRWPENPMRLPSVLKPATDN